jgi:hypothetical protein
MNCNDHAHQWDALLKVALQRQQLAVPGVPPRHRRVHPLHLAAAGNALRPFKSGLLSLLAGWVEACDSSNASCRLTAWFRWWPGAAQ